MGSAAVQGQLWGAGARDWAAVVERVPEGTQHLAVHAGHLVAVNDADRAAWDAGGHALLGCTLTGTADEVRHRLADLAARGVTEIVFQPCGSDVGRELARFLAAARG